MQLLFLEKLLPELFIEVVLKLGCLSFRVVTHFFLNFRYKAFKKLHNRMLLWHGSRTSNFAGILSQGLRIAPPEAPVTGYMFGKGIYFADMVSKSANYCQASFFSATSLSNTNVGPWRDEKSSNETSPTVEKS